MTNLTAFFLVLTLTGTPAAGVACVADCGTAPATPGHCHEDAADINGPMISAGVSCYDPSVAESLYLIEHRALTSPAILAAAFSPTMPIVAIDALGVRPPRTDSWRQPPLVLRI